MPEGAFLGEKLIPDLAEFIRGEGGGNLGSERCGSFGELAAGEIHHEGAAKCVEVRRGIQRLALERDGREEKHGEE